MPDPRISTRVDPDLVEALDRLAEEGDRSRSAVIRELIEAGLSQVRLGRAVEAYSDGQVGFWAAARMADVPLWSFMDVLRERRIGVPARYTLQDAEEDVRQALGAGA